MECGRQKADGDLCGKTEILKLLIHFEGIDLHIGNQLPCGCVVLLFFFFFFLPSSSRKPSERGILFREISACINTGRHYEMGGHLGGIVIPCH